MEYSYKPLLFQKAFEKHSDELFRHAFARLSDRERALEITQEAFLRAWTYISKGEEIRQYRSFLYRILNNLVVDEYRKHKTDSLDALLENEKFSSAIEGMFLRDDTDILEEATVRFDSKRASKALRSLPKQYRSVLVSRYMEGLSPSEIAKQTHESENAISVRIHRGLRKLRDMLELEPETF